jgi:hypothetical protein
VIVGAGASVIARQPEGEVMNKKSRKLALDTETLMPLQADDINKVNGGQATIISLPTLTITLTTTLTRTSGVSDAR